MSDWRAAAGVKPENDWRAAAKAPTSPVMKTQSDLDAFDSKWKRTSPDAPAPELLDALKPTAPIGAIGQGAMQGLSAGFSDEGMGAADASIEAARRLVGRPRLTEPVPAVDPNSPPVRKSWEAFDRPAAPKRKPVLAEQPPEEVKEPSLADVYRSARDKYRGDIKSAQEAHPYLEGGAELATGLALPMPGGGGGSLAAKMVRGGLGAGVVGTLAGAGKSEANTVGGVAKDAAISGLVSAPLGAATAGVVGAATPKLRNYSNVMAANVAGGGRGQIADRMAKLGYDAEDIPEFGKQLLDKGLIPTGLHPTQSPVEGVLERANALKAKSGQRIGDILEKSDTEGAFDPRVAQHDIAESLPRTTPIERENATKATDFARQVGGLAPGPNNLRPELPDEASRYSSFKNANLQKSQAWDAANFDDKAPMEAKQYRRAVASLRDSIGRQVEQVSGKPIAAGLGEANTDFGLASDAAKLSGNAVSRGAQAGQFGLPGALMMAGAGALGAGEAGARGAAGASTAALLASALLKARGPTWAARGGRVASDVLEHPAVAPGSRIGTVGSALDRYFNGLSDDEQKKLLQGSQ